MRFITYVILKKEFFFFFFFWKKKNESKNKMNELFNFDGRSRPTKMFFSRDHQRSRNVILQEARREREKRERKRVQQRAALCIQRNARLWLSRIALADRAAGFFLSTEAEPYNAPVFSLWQLCCCFDFIARVKRRTAIDNFCRSKFLRVIFLKLSSCLHAGTLKSELAACGCWLELLLCMLLDNWTGAFSFAVEEEEDKKAEEARWEAERETLFAVFFDTFKTLGCQGKLIVCVIHFLIQYGIVGKEFLLLLLRDSCATVPAGDLRIAMETSAAQRMLLDALTSPTHVIPYALPTACALDVLLALPHEEGCAIDAEVNLVLVEAITSAAVKDLSMLLTARPSVTLGKLVRMIPFFLTVGSLGGRNSWGKWLNCLGSLTLEVSSKEDLILTTLQDLYHTHSMGYLKQKRYEHLSTYLFSSEYGLLLLRDSAAVLVSSNKGNVGEFKGESTTQFITFTEFDSLCGIFAWPLYGFAYPSSKQHTEVAAIILKLANTPGLLRNLWQLYQDSHSSVFEGLTSGSERGSLLSKVKAGEIVYLAPTAGSLEDPLNADFSTSAKGAVFEDPYPALSVLFFTLLSYFVDATDFLGELERNVVMDASDAVILILALKGIVHCSHFYGIVPYGNSEAVAQAALILLARLHVIDEARPFVPHPSVWITNLNPMFLSTFGSIRTDMWTSLMFFESSDERENDVFKRGGENGVVTIRHSRWERSCAWSQQERCIRILQASPFIIPFYVRASVFTAFILNIENNPSFGGQDNFVVHRGRVFADAFDRFADNPDSPEMHYVRFFGFGEVMEDGYGDGVYREFLVSLCTEGFAAEFGLFCLTDDGYVYPNPFSYEVTGDSRHLQRIMFLGAMVGRALRDGVLQDVPFALHFRNAILGRSNSINTLESFDKQLYRHLVSLSLLKEEEFEALALNFTCTVDVLGDMREFELLPGGSNIAVTIHNFVNYIYLIADFRLNRQSARQTKAFRSGLERIVDRSWLRLFDSKELMRLFGGDSESAIDVSDWRQHTQYHAESDVNSEPVQVFWQVVESMSFEQRKKLLKFSTSMNRPPLLGFRFFNPPFKLHIVWDAPEDRLPSASTCFSTLKLPPYTSVENARAKILSAIEETDGFAFS